MVWLICLCYFIMAYGACNVIVFGSGPFRIFERLRYWANGVSEHFGMLFSCMMCLPANFGLVISLFDWFIIRQSSFVPFNIIFDGTNLWWLAALCDGAITTGAVWLIHNFESFFENIGQEEKQPQNDSEPSIEADDITLKREILND